MAGFAQRHRVVVTSSDIGVGTGFTNVVTGRLLNIIYTKGDYEDGVDFWITADGSGIPLWNEDDVNASKIVSPRQATHDTAGVEQDTAGDVALGDIYLASERISIEVEDAGDSKTGTFDIIIAGPSG